MQMHRSRSSGCVHRQESFGLTPGSRGSKMSLWLTEGSGTRRADFSFKEGAPYTRHPEGSLRKLRHGFFPSMSATQAAT